MTRKPFSLAFSDYANSNPQLLSATEGLINRQGGKCLMSGSAIPFAYIRSEGQAGHIGQKLMAIVVESEKGRVYLSPSEAIEKSIKNIKQAEKPEVKLEGKCRVNVSNYGIDVYGDLFTSRQIQALTTFSDLVLKTRTKSIQDAVISGLPDDGVRLSEGGRGATAYGDALAIYLTFGVNRGADAWSSIVTWRNQVEASRNTFSRQAIPMTWDFRECPENGVNSFSS